MNPIEKLSPIVALRTKDGIDVLGLYVGEFEATDIAEAGIILYRPISIKSVSYDFEGTTVWSYESDLYFRYGSNLLNFQYNNLKHHDLASEFFTTFYNKSCANLITREDTVSNSYTKWYAKTEAAEVIQKSDGMFMEVHSDYPQ